MVCKYLAATNKAQNCLSTQALFAAVASGTILQPFSNTPDGSSVRTDTTTSTATHPDRPKQQKPSQQPTEDHVQAAVHAAPSADSIRQGILEASSDSAAPISFHLQAVHVCNNV